MMTKRYLLAILMLVISKSVWGQSGDHKIHGRITYERVLHYEREPDSTTFTLIFGPETSAFYERQPDSTPQASLKRPLDRNNIPSIQINLHKDKYIVLTDFKKDSIFSQIALLKGGAEKLVIVGEKIHPIDWTILNEHKTIGQFEAQKATGYFRGRQYTVWFTSQIPVRYGPWKLNGLPGLILSATDKTHEVAFFVTNITIPFALQQKNKKAYQFDPKAENISLGEYVKLKSKQLKQFKNLFLSRLPRGAKMDISDVKTHSIELKYGNQVNN